MDLESTLEQLAKLTDKATERWHKEYEEGYVPDGHVWLELQHDDSYGGPAWGCGYAYMEDEGSEWVEGLVGHGDTPTEAAQALLSRFSDGEEEPRDFVAEQHALRGGK